jgi:hypothetical protein
MASTMDDSKTKFHDFFSSIVNFPVCETQHKDSTELENTDSQKLASTTAVASAAVAAASAEEAEVNFSQTTDILKFPALLFDAFNAGDWIKMDKILHDLCTPECCCDFKYGGIGPCMYPDRQFFGVKAVCKYWKGLTEICPDAVITLKEVKIRHGKLDAQLNHRKRSSSGKRGRRGRGYFSPQEKLQQQHGTLDNSSDVLVCNYSVRSNVIKSIVNKTFDNESMIVIRDPNTDAAVMPAPTSAVTVADENFVVTLYVSLNSDNRIVNMSMIYSMAE